MNKQFFFFLTTLMAPLASYGEVYKCIDDNGLTTFAQMPCAPLPPPPGSTEKEEETAVATQRLANIELRLTELQNHIDSLRDERQDKIIELEREEADANVVYKKRTALRTQYNTKIEKGLIELTELRRERASLIDR